MVVVKSVKPIILAASKSSMVRHSGVALPTLPGILGTEREWWSDTLHEAEMTHFSKEIQVRGKCEGWGSNFRPKEGMWTKMQQISPLP